MAKTPRGNNRVIKSASSPRITCASSYYFHSECHELSSIGQGWSRALKGFHSFSVLALRTASYRTENEWTPGRAVHTSKVDPTLQLKLTLGQWRADTVQPTSWAWHYTWGFAAFATETLCEAS